MLPQDQGEHSRYGTHPEGDPHLSLPGIRDIFGLEATGGVQPRAKGPFTNPCPVCRRRSWHISVPTALFWLTQVWPSPLESPFRRPFCPSIASVSD